MVAEAGELANGWPLGLENMNIRLRIVAAGEPYTSSVRSPSFSSFTTSELNTESTRSFFQDPSVSLGRLIGLKPPGQVGDFYLTTTDSIRLDECQRVSVGGSAAAPSNANAINRHETSQGSICIPMLLSVLVKISPSKSTSRG